MRLSEPFFDRQHQRSPTYLNQATGTAQGPPAALTAHLVSSPRYRHHHRPELPSSSMPFNLAKWFIEGEVDWDYYQELLQSWGPALAGALFGAGGRALARASGRELLCWLYSISLCRQHSQPGNGELTVWSRQVYVNGNAAMLILSATKRCCPS